MNFGDPRLPERFWSKVMPEPNSGCWLWIGATSTKGYGNRHRRIGGKRIVTLVHRDAAMAAYGVIDPSKVVDHLCRVRCCVNPAHLDVTTQSENMRRGDGGIARGSVAHWARKLVRCKHGHEFTEANTHITSEGHRCCRTCGRLRVRARRLEQRSGPP